MTTHGLFGRLPRDPEKRRLYIGPIEGMPLPTPPPAIDRLSNVPLELDGNGKYGNCVVVSFRNHFYATWMALRPGEPVPPITEKDCIDFYCAMVGSTTPPGPGLVTEKALDYLLKHGLGGQVPLAWGTPRDDLMTIKQTDAEFIAGIYGVNIRAGQEYPARIWDHTTGPVLGGHEIGGGAYDPTYIKAATWAYVCKMTSSYVANDLDEHHVIIWPHVWDHLSYDRQVVLAAEYQTLTGKPFPVTPVPPPTPVAEAHVILLPKPVRIFDAAIAAQHLTALTIGGLSGIPADATGAVLIIRAVKPPVSGWVYVGPDQGGVPSTSTLDFISGQTIDGFPTVALTGGKLTVYATQALPRFVIDVAGYLSTGA